MQKYKAERLRMLLKLTFCTLRANSLLLSNFIMKSLINIGFLALPNRVELLARLVLSVKNSEEYSGYIICSFFFI